METRISAAVVAALGTFVLLGVACEAANGGSTGTPVTAAGAGSLGDGSGAGGSSDEGALPDGPGSEGSAGETGGADTSGGDVLADAGAGPGGGRDGGAGPGDGGGSRDAGHDAGADDGGTVLRARVSLEGEGCPTGSTPAPTSERVPLSRFELHDRVGDATTLRTYCTIVHEIAMPRGYRVAAGTVTGKGEVSLEAGGRGSIKFRTQVDDAEPTSSLVAVEGPYDGAWTPTAEWPSVAACESAATVRVETQISLTMRAERASQEPRHMAVRVLEFPRLIAIPCNRASGVRAGG